MGGTPACGRRQPPPCPAGPGRRYGPPSEGATVSSVDSFGSKGTLEVGDASYEIFRLAAVPGVARLPYSLKILAENLLRTEDGLNTTADHVRAIAAWTPTRSRTPRSSSRRRA